MAHVGLARPPGEVWDVDGPLSAALGQAAAGGQRPPVLPNSTEAESNLVMAQFVATPPFALEWTYVDDACGDGGAGACA